MSLKLCYLANTKEVNYNKCVNRDSQKEIFSFFNNFKPTHYKRRETIIRPSLSLRDVFYLKNGYVKCYTVSKEGGEFTLIIFKPGDIFPICWATNPRNSYYFETLSPCEIYSVDRKKLLSFIKKSPHNYSDLNKSISIRAQGLLQRMEYLVFGDARERIASILIICAARFGKKGKTGIVIQSPLAQRDIASLIGIARETASIELNKLKRANIISIKGKSITVLLPKTLKRISLLAE